MTFNQPSWDEIASKVEHGVVQIITPHGSGSGFVVSEGGHVITNAHVVSDANGRVHYDVPVTLLFLDNVKVDGVILDTGIRDNLDLACLQVIGNPLKVPLDLGNSDSIRKGEEVIAVGYPALGQPQGTSTVTRGIVSTKYPGELHTDAAINPGNSGGPLIDRRGNVIGVNTRRIDRTPGGRTIEGGGFAIAANVVKQQFPFIARAVQPAADETDTPALARPETSGDGTPGPIIFDERFSITNLPRGWELSPGATRNFARMQSGDSSLFLHLVETGDNLRTVADINRQSLQVRAYTWAFGEVSRQLSRGEHQGKESFHFNYKGEYRDGNGVFKGRYNFSHLEGVGRRYILAAILVTGENSPDDKAGLELFVDYFLRRLKPA